MFKNTYQSGFLSILYSIGSKPLQIWDKQSNTPTIQFITDTSSDLPTKTFNLLCCKSWELTLQQLSSPRLKTKTKLLALSCPF